MNFDILWYNLYKNSWQTNYFENDMVNYLFLDGNVPGATFFKKKGFNVTWKLWGKLHARLSTQLRLIILLPILYARRRVCPQTKGQLPPQSISEGWCLTINVSCWANRGYFLWFSSAQSSEPSCSNLTMSLVNVSLKLWSLNMVYTLIFLLKNVSSFCICKSYSHFFSKNTCELDILLTKTVNILITKELFKLTMLWTTGPRSSLNP